MMSIVKHFVFFGTSLLVASCSVGPQTDVDSNSKSITTLSEANGSVTAQLNNINMDQEINASGSELGDMSIMFPAGSLAIPTDLSISADNDIPRDTILANLNSDLDVVGAGTTVSVTPDVAQNPITPITLSLPVPSTFSLAEKYPAIIYEIYNYTTKRYKSGIIATDKVKVIGGKFEFQTSYFGKFAPIYLNKAATDLSTDPSEGSITSEQMVSFAGKFLAAGASFTDFFVACLSFEKPPRVFTNDLDTSGAFEVKVPKDVSFGCRLKAKTGENEANFVVSDETYNGLGKFGFSSLSLSDSVDAGDLSIDIDGTVAIPTATVLSKLTPIADTTDVNLLHDSEFKISCVGPDKDNQDCLDKVGGSSASVYLRVLKGQESGDNITGLSIWADKASFEGCGGVDVSQTEFLSVGFSQGNRGTFESICINANAQPEPRYELGQLSIKGKGYSMYSSTKVLATDNCDLYRTSTLDFAGKDGMFAGLLQEYSSFDGPACASEGLDQIITESFSIKLEKI